MRSIVAPGFTAGSDYYDYFQPVLEYGPRAAHDPAYWADGRPRRFSNDAIGFWQSQCFVKGGASCTTCHLDPHLPDIERNPQLAAGNNALCTGCHTPIAANLTAHTRHRPQSRGSSCVECHMPNTVVGIKARMRDHSIGVPVPENTVRHGVPNACSECHANQSPAWAVAAVERWWPRADRRTRMVEQADAFAGARDARPEALPLLLAIATDALRPPLIRANAIGHLAGYDDARATAMLTAALKGSHPAIRAAAADALGQRLAERPAAGPALLSALDDPRRSVRVAAVVAFVNAGGQDPPPADRARFARASEEFAARAALYEDDPDLQRSLGIVRLLNGQFDAAAGALQIVLKLAPDTPSARYLLALARLGQQRVDDARTLLNDVKESDPYYRNARLRLQELR
jgi:predicted CXXCH cytochrome family protein